jgi:transcriptional regulator with XRE-family HTH domain
VDKTCPDIKIIYIFAENYFAIFMTIGEQLRTLREKSSLSLREVSVHIGVDSSLLGKIERNERQPTKQQIKNIASFFEVEEKKLMTELLSDQIVYKILDEEADLNILKVAEEKIEYLISQRNV